MDWELKEHVLNEVIGMNQENVARIAGMYSTAAMMKRGNAVGSRARRMSAACLRLDRRFVIRACRPVRAGKWCCRCVIL